MTTLRLNSTYSPSWDWRAAALGVNGRWRGFMALHHHMRSVRRFRRIWWGTAEARSPDRPLCGQ